MSEPGAVATGPIDRQWLIGPVATAPGSDPIQSAVEPAHSKLVLLAEEATKFHAFRENINKNRAYVECERVYVDCERVYVDWERVYVLSKDVFVAGESFAAKVLVYVRAADLMTVAQRFSAGISSRDDHTVRVACDCQTLIATRFTSQSSASRTSRIASLVPHR